MAEAQQQDARLHRVFLALGANIGDRQANLACALSQIAGVITIQTISSVYETTPVGYLDQPLFLNLVCQGETALDADALLRALKTIEERMGRQPSFRNAPRPIDIDILLYENSQICLPHLTIPHPRMRERAFVLIPLAEIAPHVTEPASKRTIEQLVKMLPAQGIHKKDIALSVPDFLCLQRSRTFFLCCKNCAKNNFCSREKILPVPQA
jgi:2-amino-4-hydroxy-6-hydroxymethyldihydropteridine diphosphokinase